jgi:hypothetical protein
VLDSEDNTNPPEHPPARPETKHTWLLMVDAQPFAVSLSSREATEFHGFVDFFNALYQTRSSVGESFGPVMTLRRMQEVPLTGDLLVELLRALVKHCGEGDCINPIQTALHLAVNQDGKIAFRGAL